jgi:CspA family cold shock protein
MQGTVKFFDKKKGYGFITDSDGKDVFVHHSNIVMDGFRHLNEDDVVNFELGTGNDGRKQAVSVIPVLTRKMIEDVLKKDNLHIQTMKDGYGVTKYIVINELDIIQTDEKGMTLMEVAEYAGFEIRQLSA